MSFDVWFNRTFGRWATIGWEVRGRSDRRAIFIPHPTVKNVTIPLPWWRRR